MFVAVVAVVAIVGRPEEMARYDDDNDEEEELHMPDVLSCQRNGAEST